VNYYDYRRKLKRLIRSFGNVRKMRLAADGEAAPAVIARGKAATPERVP
jgi:hypothetical protein